MDHTHSDDYRAGSLILLGSIAMGTGVMIGAGIFADEWWFVRKENAIDD